jgi:YgiT-type zinc finger domain-containing protein
MKCAMCKNGDLVEGTTTVMLEQDGTIIVFKNVPALVCDQCDESYTDQDVTRRLLQVVQEEAQSGPKEEFVQYAA